MGTCLGHNSNHIKDGTEPLGPGRMFVVRRKLERGKSWCSESLCGIDGLLDTESNQLFVEQPSINSKPTCSIRFVASGCAQCLLNEMAFPARDRLMEDDDRHRGQQPFRLEALEKPLSSSTGHLPIAERKVGSHSLKQGDPFFSIRCDACLISRIRQQLPQGLSKASPLSLREVISYR